jgi:hypothetical protein
MSGWSVVLRKSRETVFYRGELIIWIKCGFQASRREEADVCVGRTYGDIHHILLLPTGLADGLGQEVSCPTGQTTGFAPKEWVPRSSGSGPKDSAILVQVNDLDHINNKFNLQVRAVNQKSEPKE